MAHYSALLLLCLLSVVKLQQDKKNVLFFAIDDLRTQLSVYGENIAQTPSIDALAAESMVFERAYCQVAVCSPSRASLLTGRRPDTNHVWEIASDEYWRNFTNATTIPQYFKDNGYVSIGMGKIFHPGAPSGHDDIKYSWSLPYFHGSDDVKSPNAWACFKNASDNALTDGKIADKAVETLKEIKLNRTKGDNTPFFLAVGFHKPHLPFFAPSKYCDLYPEADKVPLAKNPDAPTKMPPIAWVTIEGFTRFKDMKKYHLPECQSDVDAAMRGDRCRVTDEDAHVLRRAYYSSLSFTDAQLGRVMMELDNQGLAKDTIVVLWADHGWKLGEHNMWRKFANFEDDTHVPFMLRVPGMTDAGMRTSALVELIDIFPSLTELAGLKVPPLCPEGNKDILACVEGSSVAPLLKDPKQEWKKAAFSQFPRPESGLSSIPGKQPFKPNNHGEAVMGYAVRADTYRFIEWYTFNRTTAKPDWDSVWGTELYNHTYATKFFNDENENLAEEKDMAEIVKEMRKILQAGWKSVLPPTKKTTE